MARPESEEFVKELIEIPKRPIRDLVREFETVLAEADKLYKEIEQNRIEDGISRTKQRTVVAPLD